MEEYKRIVDSQHAPEALIGRTLQRIHEEERKMQQNNVPPVSMQQNSVPPVPMQQNNVPPVSMQQNNVPPVSMQQNSVPPVSMQQNSVPPVSMQQNSVPPVSMQQPQKKKSRRVYTKWISAVAGMAAGLALIIGVMNSQSGLHYNSMPENTMREATLTGIWLENPIDVETYNDYLGKDMVNVSEDMTLVQEDIYVCYDDAQSEIIEDEGTFYYNMDGHQIMVKVSKTLEVAPEELLAGEASEWDDMTVYAGKNEAGNQLFAAVEQGELHYFVMGLNLSESEFEDFLEEFF